MAGHIQDGLHTRVHFVLAHAKCSASKGSLLACEDNLGRWTERNRRYGGQIASECDRVRSTSYLGATVQIGAGRTSRRPQHRA